jgi:hypothetical protein
MNNSYEQAKEDFLLSFRQQIITEIGVEVFGSPSAFHLWMDTPELRDLFDSMEGLDALEENIVAISEGYF